MTSIVRVSAGTVNVRSSAGTVNVVTAVDDRVTAPFQTPSFQSPSFQSPKIDGTGSARLVVGVGWTEQEHDPQGNGGVDGAE